MGRYDGGARHISSRRSTTGVVIAKSGVLHGYYVNTVIGAGTVTLSSVEGNFLVIPAAAAAGSWATGLGIAFSGNLTATFVSTGDITFIYDTAT
jgi:hypothetical protein